MSRSLFIPLLPAALAAGSACWFGAFWGAAGSLGAAVLVLVLLSSAAVCGRCWLDPWRLGLQGRWLLVLLLLAVVLSTVFSEVPRAGRTAVWLLPAFLLLPVAVARCWETDAGRRRGLLGLGVAVLAVAGWALGESMGSGFARAAEPLGHHRLLACWLVTLLPLAALGLRSGGREGERCWPGRLAFMAALAAVVVGSTAVIASGSLLGIFALALQGGLGLLLLGRRAPARMRLGLGAVAAAALLILALHPRMGALATLEDSSLQARTVYWKAGLEGFSEAPLLGQGPGSAPWTLGRWLEPIPGVSPPRELVGDLHSLPLGLLFDLGLFGTLAALAALALFWRRRWQHSLDRPTTLAAALGTAGFLIVSLGGAPLSVPALPLALAVVMGMALSTDGRNPAEENPASIGAPPWNPESGNPDLGNPDLGNPDLGNPDRGNPDIGRLDSGRPDIGRPESKRPVSWLPVIYAAVALLALIPSLRAQRLAETPDAAPAGASTGPSAATAAVLLERAALLDPDFPLYRFRRAAVTGDAAEALDAARGVPGVAAPWLLAGRLAVDAGETGAEALEAACRLDVLAGAAPFLRLLGDPAASQAPSWAARALLAEPRLLAATFWQTREELRREAVGLIARLEGVEEGWRVRLLEVTAVVEALEMEQGEELMGEAAAPPPVSQLAVVADRPGFGAFSLHHFRRLPRALDLAVFGLGTEAAAAVDLPPASHLGTTDAALFLSGGCHLGGNSGAPGS